MCIIVWQIEPEAHRTLKSTEMSVAVDADSTPPRPSSLPHTGLIILFPIPICVSFPP